MGGHVDRMWCAWVLHAHPNIHTAPPDRPPEHVRGDVTTMPTLTPVPPVVQSPSPVPTPAEPVSSAPTTSTAVIPTTTASRAMCTHPTFVGQNGAYFIDAHFVHKYQSSAPVAAGVRLMVGEEEHVNVRNHNRLRATRTRDARSRSNAAMVCGWDRT